MCTKMPVARALVYYRLDHRTTRTRVTGIHAEDVYVRLYAMDQVKICNWP